MKKKLAKIASALLAVLMLTTSVFAASASDFTDVNLDAWYGDTLTYAVDHSMVNGKSATTFAPYDTMTRSQFIAVFGRAMNGSGTNTYKFTDVDNNAYYIPYLYWGVENGIINGTGDTTFSPNSPITRQDMATIVGRAIGNLGLNVAAGDKIADGFQDAPAISGYAQPSVELLRTLGIVNGDNKGNFNPKKNMTRIEGTAVLVRLVQQIQPADAPTDPTVTPNPGDDTTEEDTYMVWIPTNGGTKYHKTSTCSGMENPEYVTKQAAIDAGFTPCKRCFG